MRKTLILDQHGCKTDFENQKALTKRSIRSHDGDQHPWAERSHNPSAVRADKNFRRRGQSYTQ